MIQIILDGIFLVTSIVCFVFSQSPFLIVWAGALIIFFTLMLAHSVLKYWDEKARQSSKDEVG